jgi:bifunctional non-homologous end joining protein LigD
LALNGEDLRQHPLSLRKAVLKQGLKKSPRIRFVQHIDREGERLFAMAESLGLEGIVAKRATAPCPKGRTHD